MQEKLNQFERNQVWHLVPRPHDRPTIGTKWIFRNKLDESDNVVRNKARLVAQGYTQIEGIDFEETFAPVARHLLLLLIKISNFSNGCQKCIFKNGFIEENVYVEQPPVC